MQSRYGIKFQVLLLALIPTIVISLLLGIYFTTVRLDDLAQSLRNHSIIIASRLASIGEYGVFVGDNHTLSKLGKNELNNDVSSIVFYNSDGAAIVTEGKTNIDTNLLLEDIDITDITYNETNETISCLMPITLPEVVIDNYKPQQNLSNENLKKIIIGWVKVELERKATQQKEYQILLHSCIIILLGLSISSLLALRMGSNVTKPILALTNAVGKIKQGKLNTRVHATTQWELAILESGINTMACSLQKAHNEMQNNIEQATADLRQTLKTIEIQNVELELARKEAENASKIKSEFLASMSHELRTPLNGIIGFINLLQKTELNARQKDYLNTIQKSANTLLFIISDILDFSKIEAGKLYLDLTPMNITECAEDALTLLAPSAHEKAIELVYFVYNDVPDKILADHFRIKQVITNLVNNAIKFTEKGSVTVRVMLEKEATNDITLCISITDTGIGLNEEQQKKLFQAFSQVDPRIAKKFGGSGLGLVICKKIVEQMDGKIGMESELGKGATFWFTIKVEKMLADDTIQKPSKTMLNSIKILLFERHPITRSAITHLLTKWGIQIQEINDPQDITKAVRQAFKSGYPFQMVLIGINQVESEVYFIRHVINSIKETFSCPVGILANTTNHIVHNKMLQLGAALCLAKPICQEKFHDALCEIFLHSLEPQPIATNLPQLEILAVDDNAANLKLVAALLENIGITVTPAASGVEALACIHKKKFNLILMDIRMPGMDGIETSLAIRKTNTPNKNIPIVALSAHVLLNEQNVFRNANINDYLTKPVSENQLKAAIYKWTQYGIIKHKETKLPTTNNVTFIKTEFENTEQDLKSIDWDLAKKLAAGKLDLAQDMLHMLVKTLKQEQTLINTAYQKQNLSVLHEHVHRLHGGCSYAGVPKLKSIVQALETAITIKATEKISALIISLNKEIDIILSIWKNKSTIQID